MWPGLTITMCGHYYWAGLVKPVNLLHSHILPFKFNIKPSRLYWTFSLRGETMNVHVSVEVVLLCVGLLEYCWDLKYFLTTGEARQGGGSRVLGQKIWLIRQVDTPLWQPQYVPLTDFIILPVFYLILLISSSWIAVSWGKVYMSETFTPRANIYVG